MTYSTERGRVGRMPFQIVKLSLDYCVIDYGINGSEVSGTLASATSTTAVLDGGEATDDFYIGYALSITGGTGSGQIRRIDDWDGGTLTATVATWDTTPDNTSTYSIIGCTAGVEASGVLQAVTATTADLETSSSVVDSEYVNYFIHITGGTGLGQRIQITAYDGTNQRITVAGWTTTPDTTSTYTIIKRPTACYNTRATCQDTANYSKSSTAKEIYLTESSSDFPKGLLDTENLAVAIPCVKRVSITPPVIKLGDGLSIRSTADITCADFPYHDRGLDKYVDSRSYDPESQGTFFGKLLSRNPYYNARFLYIYRGYLTEAGVYDSTNFEKWAYVIEKIDGPNTNDEIKITAKDLISLAEDKKAQAPAPSQGALLSAITAGDGSLELTPTGSGDLYYGTSGYVRIDKEIITYTRTAGSDTLTLSARNAWGTAAAAHNAGATVQECLAYESSNVVDIVTDLITNYTTISSTYLDSANWATEKSDWLSGATLTNIITKPTGIYKLLSELAEQTLFYMWWDAVNQLIKLKALAPTDSTTTLSDSDNFLAKSISVVQDTSKRLSQVWVYYGVIDYSEVENKKENYENIYLSLNTAEETDDLYADTRAKEIVSRWITTEGVAVQTAGRLLAAYKNAPKIVNFKLDNKDDISLGDVVTLSTRYIQDTDGSAKSIDGVVIEDRELESGSTVQYKVQEFSFLGTYGFIGYSQHGNISTITSTTLDLDTSTADSSTTDYPDITIDENFTYVEDVLANHDLYIYDSSGTLLGNHLITAYDATNKRVTISGSFSATEISSGATYLYKLPEFSSDLLLLESGGYFLFEDGSFMALEQSSLNGATVAQKETYAWISPDSGTFDDGSTAYKII